MPVECPGRGHRANSQSRSAPETGSRHQTSVRNPRPTLIGRASNRAPMSTRAVVVIRSAPTIIARLAFLCILSGLLGANPVSVITFAMITPPASRGFGSESDHSGKEWVVEQLPFPTSRLSYASCGVHIRDVIRVRMLVSIEAHCEDAADAREPLVASGELEPQLCIEHNDCAADRVNGSLKSCGVEISSRPCFIGL